MTTCSKAPEHYPQIDMYNDCLRLHAHKHGFMAFIDVDEVRHFHCGVRWTAFAGLHEHLAGRKGAPLHAVCTGDAAESCVNEATICAAGAYAAVAMRAEKRKPTLTCRTATVRSVQRRHCFRHMLRSS